VSRRKRAQTDHSNDSQSDDRDPPEHSQRTLTPAAGEGRLLLVQDHPDLAAYLAERLSEYMPVTCVGSAERALEVLATDPAVRLVLSDVVLPRTSGLDLCRHLAGAAEDDRVPVILISAKATAADRDAGLAAGAVAYLTKPFVFESLLAALARAWPALASVWLSPKFARRFPE
jgi:CheY-like chemotaxis protein